MNANNKESKKVPEHNQNALDNITDRQIKELTVAEIPITGTGEKIASSVCVPCIGKKP